MGRPGRAAAEPLARAARRARVTETPPRRRPIGCLRLGVLLLGAALLCGVATAGVGLLLRDGGARPPAEVARDGADDGAAPARRAVDGGAPRRGGSLSIPGGDPTSLDPAEVRDVVSAQYIYEVHCGLVTLAPDLAVIPDLASDWTTSPDGTVYTFTLRAGATFHDGRPVGAQDVRFAIERACDPTTAPDVAQTYLGDVVGCSDKLAGRADEVAGVSAPDDATLVLAIDAPKAYFLAKLTYPTSFVVDREQVGDPGWEARPNGCGPFRLAEYAPEERIRLERHDGYHREPAWLDEVVFDLRPIDPLTRYENGEIDASPVGIADLERVRDPLNPLASEVVEGPGDLGLSYLAFDVRREPFDDVHVRRAFAHALDREWLASVVLRDAVAPLGTILPPGMPGYDPSAATLDHDLEAARRELAASRYGSADALPPITWVTPDGGGGSPAVQAVVERFREDLGVAIEIEQAPWDLFNAELDAGRYQGWFLGWSADYADPQDFLDVLFHGDSPLNASGYAEPEVDALLEAARVEPDPDARLDAYHRAERRILTDSPWLPLYHGVETWLVSPDVRGFVLPPVIVPRLARVWRDAP